MQFLARELGESRLLVVGAYRDIDPSPSESLTRVLTELAREPVTKRLTLTGLSEPDVARYIEFVSGEVPGAGLVVAIHEETEGNPLFVGEIVRLLAVEGGLDDAAVPVLAIPQGVRDVIARRLRHLSSECNRVLVLASVLGREFALDALASVSGLAEADLLEALDEAMQARVASDVPGSPGRLRFAHVLIRDTLYDGLTTVGRVRLHRLAADALEQLYNPDLGPHLAELAHHAIAGSDFTRGSDYARRAGDRALVLLAYEEAARLYEIALEAIDLASPLDERTRCHLLLSLGETRARAGDMAAAKRVFLEAAELSGRLDLPRELAQSAAGYGGRIVFERAGGDERLVPLLEAGLAGLGPNDIELQVRLLARLAGALRDEHSRQRRDRLSAEAVNLARRTGDPAALAYALDGRCAAILAPDTITEYLELATELLELSNRLDDREHLVHAHNHRVIAQILIGDVHLAEAELEASSRVAEELGQPAQLWLQYAARAMLALAAGKQTEAQDLVPKAFAFGGRAQVMALSVYWLQGYALCDFHGGIEQIEPEISELAAHNPARPVLRCALTHLYARLGRTAQAAAELADLSTNDFAVLPFDMEWLYAVSLAEICAALGDQDSAAVLYRQLAPWAMLNTVDLFEGARGSASRYLGLLASAMSRWDDAAQHFEQALVMNQRMGARPWLAHTQHDYARTLIARNDRGDRERANELLDHALATYHELGMHNYATNTAELIKRELTTTPNSTAQPS
jgi:tetratricopeptide (TPR) repeat protein